MTASKKTLIAKEIGPDLMLYNSELDEVHILNPVAQMIYRLHNEGKTMPEIEEEVRNSFTTEGNEDILKDIEDCIEVLRKKGLMS